MADIRNSLFGALAIQTGLVSQVQIDECLLIQDAAREQGKRVPRLGELLAHKGILTPDQVKRLLRRQMEDAGATIVPASPLASTKISVAKSTPPKGETAVRRKSTTGVFAETKLFDTNEEEVVAEFGRFRLMDRLGSDADGMTFKAKMPDTEEPVILRTISPKLSRDADFVRRFTDQAKRASLLKHPNIARVLSAGKVDEQYYYTAEYVEGKSLRRSMNRFGAMDPKQVLDMAIGVAEALETGHARGIFHQHLRPSYILLTDTGGVSVSGFGILPDPIREVRQLVSTIGEMPFYIAPEQASGSGEPDARTDIYALGAIVYHALSGQPPFMGDSVEEVLVHIAEDDVPAISIINPEVPEALEEVVHAMIAPDPEDRPQNATRLISQLKAVRESLEGKAPAPVAKAPTRALRHINRTADVAEAVQATNVVAVKRMGLTEQALKRGTTMRAKRYAKKKDQANVPLYVFLGILAVLIVGFLGSYVYESMQQRDKDRKRMAEQAKDLEPVWVEVVDPNTGMRMKKQMTAIEARKMQEIEFERVKVEAQKKKDEAARIKLETVQKQKEVLEALAKQREAAAQRKPAASSGANAGTPASTSVIPVAPVESYTPPAATTGVEAPKPRSAEYDSEQQKILKETLNQRPE